ILSGNVKIDDNVFIGAGATIRDAVSIGFGAIIGAGATVIHNVPENAVVVGTPGKIIKYRSV
ncbi:TPA: transferase, partial [Streptococcus pneumoniae]|nr:transferase [Streptococcus pneumoniae]